MEQTSSHKPRKQRKWRSSAPLHARRKLIASTLSAELRKKYKIRNISVRKGDKVKVLRGEFSGSQGEITRVDTKAYKIFVEGLTIKKADGTDVEKAVDPSNVMVTDLFLEDKERKEILDRRAG